MDEDKKNWYALYTKPRAEFKAAIQLDEIKVDYYLPTVTKLKQWSDRKKKVTEPIIRGYIFIFANEKERLASIEQYSVIRCISERGKPAVIPEWQIDNLKRMLDVSKHVIVKEGLVPGVRVRIKNGPFKDVEGIFLKEENDNKLAVTIDLLNRSILAHLPTNVGIEVLKN